MSNGRGAVVRQVRTLLTIGAVGALGDRDLIDRFVSRENHSGREAAFEAIVRRHGPSVLAVCRGILRNSADADDAFQATFLVLVRRAASIRRREDVGPWLRGVARRVASKRRAQTSLRNQRERLDENLGDHQTPERGNVENRLMLLAEIDRLPREYREPVVLCELEGHSQAEAARRLEWPIGTVSGRLFRARQLLRTRLSRGGDGIALASLPIGFSVEPVSATLISRTLKLAALSGSICPRIAALAAIHGAGATLKLGVAAAAAVVFAALPLVREATSNSARVRGGAATQDRISAKASPAESLSVLPLIQSAHQGSITSLALAPDGKTLASGDSRAVVKVWDLATRSERSTLLGHTRAIASLAFAPDGRTLASTSLDHTLVLWDLASGQQRTVLCWLSNDAIPTVPGLGS